MHESFFYLNQSRLLVIEVLILVLTFSTPAICGQNEVCVMDDNIHKAYYKCSDGFEVVYTGEGEKECRGTCYRSGDANSVRLAIGSLVSDRIPELDRYPARLEDAVDTLLKSSEATIKTESGYIRLIAPKSD